MKFLGRVVHTFHGTGGEHGTRLCQYRCTCPASTHLWIWQTPQATVATAEDTSGRVTHMSTTTGCPGRCRRRSPLGAWREPCRTDSAGAACGSTGGCGGYCYSGRCGGRYRAGHSYGLGDGGSGCCGGYGVSGSCGASGCSHVRGGGRRCCVGMYRS